MRAAFLVAVLLPVLAGAAGRELAPRALGPTPYFADFPQIAYAGGRFLTIWQESRELYGPHVVAALSDAAGRPLTPTFTIVRAETRQLRLVATGDAFFVFRELYGIQQEMIEISLDGRIVSTRRIAFGGFVAGLAWNGTHFLAVLLNNQPNVDAQGVLFTRTGEVVRRHIPLKSIYQWIDIVVDGEDFVVLTSARDGLFADRLSASGAVTRTLLDESGGILPQAYRPWEVVGVSRGNGGVLAMWAISVNQRFEIKAAILGADNVKSEIQTLAVSETGLMPIGAMRTADGYTVAFAESRFDLRTGVLLRYMTAMNLDENAAPVAASGEAVLGSGGDRSIDTASAGGLMIVAYSSEPYVDRQILHRVVRATPAISEAHVVSIAPARQRQPILGAGGGQYVAAFAEESPSPRVRTASVSADGQPLTHRFIGEGTLRNKELAWNGTDYLAVIQKEKTLIAQRLDVHGEPVAGAPIIVDVPTVDTRVAVAWASDRWVVIWVDYKIWFATVSPSGIVSAPREIRFVTPLPPGGSKSIRQLALAADGPRVLVTWIEGQLPLNPPTQVTTDLAFAQRMRRDGTFIDPEPIQLADRARAVSAAAGDEFVVVVDRHEDSKLMTLESIATPLRILQSRTLPYGFSDVTWDRLQYVLAVRHTKDFPKHVIVRRFDTRLEEVEPPRGVITLRWDEYAAPSVAANDPAEVMAAVQEGDPETGARAVVYLERDMDLLPWPPPRRPAVRH